MRRSAIIASFFSLCLVGAHCGGDGPSDRWADAFAEAVVSRDRPASRYIATVRATSSRPVELVYGQADLWIGPGVEPGVIARSSVVVAEVRDERGRLVGAQDFDLFDRYFRAEYPLDFPSSVPFAATFTIDLRLEDGEGGPINLLASGHVAYGYSGPHVEFEILLEEDDSTSGSDR